MIDGPVKGWNINPGVQFASDRMFSGEILLRRGWIDLSEILRLLVKGQEVNLQLTENPF